MKKPTIIASDLEGVLVPEIWIAVAERTGIEALRLTTRDVADYDQLMQGRMHILRQHGLRLTDIQQVIATLEPLPGAEQLLRWIRERSQFIILSDTFYEFAMPLMARLGYPTIFCHSLHSDAQGMLAGYQLRQADSKRHAVAAFQSLQFRVFAMGDSYNDTSMLAAAERGVLVHPPEAIAAQFPHFPAVYDYDALRQQIEAFLQEKGDR